MNTSLFKIYRSSAGSGKTYRLAIDYLKLALQYPDYYKKILAVTFTNKATYEMKARIMNNLGDLAKGKAHPSLVDLLRNETGWDEVSLKERSGQVLKSVLHGYSYFSVSTIDSFFQKIISSFARDMGIHSGFTIEFDLDSVTEKVIDQLFMDMEEDPQLMEWLLRFTESKIEDNKGWDVRYEVKNLARELYYDRFHQYFDTFEKEILDKGKLTSLLKKLQRDKSLFQKKLKAFGQEGLEMMNRYGLSVTDFAHTIQGPGGLLAKMANGDDFNLNFYVIKAYEDQESWYAKKSDQKGQILTMLDAGLYDLYRNAIDFYQSHIQRQNTYSQVLKLYYNLGLYSNLLEKLKEYRRENSVILISDLSHLLRIIIGENDAPYIYEKVGNYYHHFLMDEFQDTSVFQWHNFRPLVKNAIAMGKYNMLVGDVKQSIYRWRGGDWQLLHNQVEQDIGEEYIRAELLNINWRSRENIISFNNFLFQALPRRIGNYYLGSVKTKGDGEGYDTIQSFSNRFTNVYADVSQGLPEINSEKKGGIVSIHFLSTDKNNESSPPWTEKVFPEVVDTIEKIQECGYALKDIAILVRTKDEGKKIADYLLGYKNLHPESSYQYDVISSESLFLNSSPAVNAVVSYMKLMLDKKDTLARINLHYWMAVLNHSPEIEEPNKIFQKAIEVIFSGDPVHLVFGSQSDDSFRSLPLVDLLIWIIRELGLENFPYEQAYLTGLQNVMLDYLSQHNGDLYSFIEWWETDGKKQSIKPAGGQNAIQILTIHKSKGLQFEKVIIPFCSWNLDHQPNAEIMWCLSHEDILREFPYYPVKYGSAMLQTDFSVQYLNERSLAYLDNLNLLYVAFTRAISGLYVFAEMPRNEDNIKSIGDVVYQSMSDLTGIKELSLERSPRIDTWGEEGIVYYIGTIPDSGKAEKVTNEFHVQIYDKGNWYHKISIRRQLDLFSREDGEYHPDEHIHYGILLHDILSRIIRKDQMDEVLENGIKSGYIQAGQQERIKEMLLKLWENAKVNDWFSGRWKVKTEVPVLPRSGQLSRMDRVMIDGDHVIVVDFKTGNLRHEHKKQVQEYKQILQLMGYNKVEGFLLYLGKGELVAI